MKCCINTESLGSGGSVALLLFRLVMGTAFLFHGWPKIQSPFTWMGPESSIPGPLLLLAAVSEFGGGLALILGCLTPIACLAIAATMVGALTIVHLPEGHPFVGKPGQDSFELAAVYLASAILLFFTGPGQWSCDRFLFGKAFKPAENAEPSKIGSGIANPTFPNV